MPGTSLKALRTSDRKLKMAERLVAEMTEDRDPEEYHDKFDIAERRSFVVQRHAARRLHYDFRLELDGVLKSWAVPKQPAPVPGQKRLAVHVEDHPLEYGSFEGEIPAGHYGAGKVVIWDRGWWEPAGDPRAGYLKGALQFILHGRKLRGRWALVRMRARDEAGDGKENWLLIKERDAPAREKPRAR